jgi:hypothetical protein
VRLDSALPVVLTVGCLCYLNSSAANDSAPKVLELDILPLSGPSLQLEVRASGDKPFPRLLPGVSGTMSPSFWGLPLSSLVVVLGLEALHVQAYNSTASYFVIGWFPRPPSAQSSHWFPKYAAAFREYSEGPSCNFMLQDYQSAFYAPPRSTEAHQLLSICYAHEACILSQLTPDVVANFQSATVVLDLMPTLLSTIGPSVADISLLSAYRPVLSFLISMGVPAIWQTRIFELNDPTLV